MQLSIVIYVFEPESLVTVIREWFEIYKPKPQAINCSTICMWIIFCESTSNVFIRMSKTLMSLTLQPNTEEAGDANTFNNNDFPDEDASHQFIRWPQIYVLDV